VEEMATFYIQAMDTRSYQGTYIVGGWSLGGVVAFEMAHQLAQSGERNVHAILFDAPVPASLSDDEPALLQALVGLRGDIDPDGHIVEVARAGSRALRRYKPPCVSFPVTIFTAAEPGVFDSLDGWRKLCAQLRVYVVPGSHHTIMRRPNVETLAALLSQTLQLFAGGPQVSDRITDAELPSTSEVRPHEGVHQ